MRRVISVAAYACYSLLLCWRDQQVLKQELSLLAVEHISVHVVQSINIHIILNLMHICIKSMYIVLK